jgi:hypothetical protein
MPTVFLAAEGISGMCGATAAPDTEGVKVFASMNSLLRAPYPPERAAAFPDGAAQQASGSQPLSSAGSWEQP